jgi:Holliday junction resolvase
MSSKKIGNSFEKIVAKDCSGTTSPGSGQIPGKKYDITDSTGTLFLECKSRKKSSNRGLKVETKWIEKLVSDYYRDMHSKQIPAIAVTTSDSQYDYLVLVNAPHIIEGNYLDIKLYGWPKEDLAVPFRVSKNAKSFAIKKPGSPGFYNVVYVPIGDSVYEFFIYDRSSFQQLVEAISAKHSSSTTQ